MLDPTCQGFEVETFVKLQALKAKLKIAEVNISNLSEFMVGVICGQYPTGCVLRTIIRDKPWRLVRSLLLNRIASPLAGEVS